jgi:hypothetical protein
LGPIALYLDVLLVWEMLIWHIPSMLNIPLFWDVTLYHWKIVPDVLIHCNALSGSGSLGLPATTKD